MTSLLTVCGKVKLTSQSWPPVKRVIDVSLCLLGLPVLFPVMVMIGIMIKLNSSGPVFFRQTRIGKAGQSFCIYKFRTMYLDIDDAGHRLFMKQYIQGQAAPSFTEERQDVYKPPAHDQVTPLGRFLRKTSLDELPQVINVLQGHMSLVGPRPHVPWEVEVYEPWHHERLGVRPGITGLAQVNGRSALSFEQMVNYDLKYIRDQGLLLDLKILLKTIGVVVKRNGAR